MSGPAERLLLDRTLIRHLKQFMRPHRTLLVLGVLLLLCGFIVDMAGFYLIRVTIDGPVTEALAVAVDQRDPALRQAMRYGGYFLAVVVAAGLLRYLQTTVLTTAGQRITYDVRTRLFQHLLRLPVSFFERRPVGELVTRATSDVENLFELFASGVITLIFDLVRVLGVLCILFFLDSRLALIALASLPLFTWIAFRFRDKARQAYGDTRKVLAQANAFLQESVSGMRTIQLSVQEDRMAGRFAVHGDSLLKAWMTTVFYFSLLFPIVELVSQGVLVSTFCVGGWMMLERSLEVGAFLQFWLCLRYVIEPIRDLAERYNVLQSALSSTERIVRILNEEPEPSGGAPRELARGAIRFDRVTFQYPSKTGARNGARPALKNVSFDIEPGETVAVVGATGAGKSTLAKLLLHLYPVTEGRAEVDAWNLSSWRLGDLRRGVGVVPQEVFLFADTVLENVRLFDPAIGSDAVLAALRQAGAGPLLEGLPRGIHTLLGERGVNLSVGERQLIAFARVLVFNPRIVVLDEATASVDSETESTLQAAMEEVLRGRTCVVIAHRLSTVRRADRILVFHLGELREAGTHRELLQLGGIYHRLHRLHFHTVD